MGRSCQPPLPDEEIVAKINSARRYAAADPTRRFSDDGNALLYVEQHGGLLRYATDARRWHAWDGRRWLPSAETVALDLARRTARSLVDFAKELETDSGDQTAALKHAARSLNAGRIEAMPRLAKSDPRVAISASDFDRDRWLLNTPSGTLDLKTGELHSHRREDYLAKITNVGYDPAAETSYWQRWLLWAMGGRADLVDFLQRAVGYAATGDTSEQVFFLLYGTGANGKTTFLNVIEHTLGDYAYHAEPDLLTPKDGAHPTGVADLQGRRFVVASETREGKKLDERAVKALTGQDTVTARHLYEDFFSFSPTHKIFFAVNHRPNVTDDSHAMWRRVLVIPWEVRIEPEGQVKDLAERIVWHEGAGVLKWIVDGTRKWREEGGLMIPQDVRLKTTEYRVREDTIGAFIEDRLIEDPTGTVSTSELATAYEMWCATEGVSSKEKLGRTALLGKIEDRLGVTRERVTQNDGRRVHGYHGWRVSTSGPGGWSWP
jgi:putative DNA primase/helicase